MEKITLAEIIEQIDNLGDNLTIYAHKNPVWNIDSPAALIEMDEFEDEEPEPHGEMDYFLEVDIAREVLEIWRKQRDGRKPTEQEKFEAILYYAENDAYQL